MSGVDYFCFPEVYRQVESCEIRQYLAAVVKPVRGAVTILYPNDMEE